MSTMGGEKLAHGIELVERLSESNTILTQYYSLLQQRVNGYTVRAYFFFYKEGIDTGIVLTEWEVKQKKHEPEKRRSLSAVNLSDLIANYLTDEGSKPCQDYCNIAKRVMDKMIKQRFNGIPLLLTSDYIIAQGDAEKIYHTIHHSLGVNHPTSNELADIINRYEIRPVQAVAETQRSHSFPTLQMPNFGTP